MDPVDEFLASITENQALIDIIAQHFFTKAPTFFALSYFRLNLDYNYPEGGNCTLINALEKYISDHNGEISLNTTITEIDAANRRVTSKDGNAFEYAKLIWCADNKALYQILNSDGLSPSTQKRIDNRRKYISNMKGNDSVISLFLSLDNQPALFEELHGPHFFYTPLKHGLHTINDVGSNAAEFELFKDKDDMTAWLVDFFKLTTYEISIPVLRDSSMAPEGKTGLIVSTLMDYRIMKHIHDMDWYEEMRVICEQTMVSVLAESVYKNINLNLEDSYLTTPLTIEERTANTEGTITGWAFTNDSMPAVSSILKISQSVKTPIPGVLQAGQWSYSPSGFPISILTGKIAADRVIKKSIPVEDRDL